MEEMEWCIELKFKDVMAMFDPVIERILQLIHAQLDANRSCKTMFLIGGFSESKYLQTRIKQEFSQKINNITVPMYPLNNNC